MTTTDRPEGSELVHIIVPVRNRRSITRRFLQCVEAQTYRSKQVVLVDDGSTDGTKEMVQHEFPSVHYIGGDGNYYWSGAVNVALRHVLGTARDEDLILIINDDLEFEPDYLDTLVTFARTRPRAVVGSVVVDIKHPDVITDGGRMINWWTAKRRLLNEGRSLRELGPVAIEPSTLTGRGVLFRARVFREIGLYDERHFPHRGDTELPVRAKKHGYELLVYYGAVVKSHVDQTYALDASRSARWRDARRNFFDIRSSGSIKLHYFFAWTTRRNWLQFLCFVSFSMVRITYFFLKRVMRSERAVRGQ